jgi:hypothetical protein
MVRKAVADQLSRTQVSRTVSIPAPVGGWDAQSAIAAMPVQNAVILDNIIPRPGYVELRNGSFAQVSSVGSGGIQGLMTWSGAGADKLLAATPTSIYDVTTQGGLSPVAIYAAATSGAWQWIDFANSAGTYLLAVNGVDTPIKYDGTTVSTTAWTGTGPPVLTPANLNLIMQHKRRVHMGEKNSLRVWFASAVDVIAGGCGVLDLGPVFTKGGVLVAMGTTSLNYGTGLDDFAVYVTSQGQVAMYQGTDPSDATKWFLIGVYSVGYPMGAKSIVKYGSDLAIITTDGVIPLSQAILKDRAQDNNVALTQRIQNAFHAATMASPPGTSGWQGILYPKGSLAIFNVPVPLSSAVQFVQNIQTGAWCRFTGINATTWAVANGNAYYAVGSNVLQWDIGGDDAGTTITYDLKTAFSNFNVPGQKRFTALRTLMNTVSWILPAVEMDVDFRDAVPTATAIVIDVSNLLPVPRYDWSAVSGIGFTAAVRMRIMASSVPPTVLAVDSLDVDEVTTGDGFGINVHDPLAAIPFQLSGFDVIFDPGGLF